MKLTWTEDIPEADGYYYIWPHNHHRYYVAQLANVLEEGQIISRLAIIRSPHGEKFDIALPVNSVYKWAGPLPKVIDND